VSTAAALLEWGRATLAGKSESPERDAEVLLTAKARLSRAALYAFSDRLVEIDDEQAYRTAVERRSRGEPVAYIVGSCGFHAIDLVVGAGVLVPRPETEHVVDAACELIDESIAAGRALTVLDAGTGSGALALAIKHARPDAEVTGIDLSPAALAVARENGRRLRLFVHWLESDWFAALADERYDLIVCNPPYVATHDPHMDALRHEPSLALDGGDDGLDAIRAVLGAAASHLEPGGHLLLEHGYDQAAAVVLIAERAGLVVKRHIEDHAGHIRVAVIELAT